MGVGALVVALIPELPDRIVAKVAERAGVPLSAVERDSMTIEQLGVGRHVVRLNVAVVVTSEELVDLITYDSRRP
jgi:hypothetical protein